MKNRVAESTPPCFIPQYMCMTFENAWPHFTNDCCSVYESKTIVLWFQENNAIELSGTVGYAWFCRGLCWHLFTHWGRVTHICLSRLTITGSDNGLSPGRRQAIIWTNAGILLIGPLGTNFSDILIEILTFSFKKMCLEVSSAKRWPCCLGLTELNMHIHHSHSGCNSLLLREEYWYT